MHRTMRQLLAAGLLGGNYPRALRTYYVAAAGNDNNDGLAPGAGAWKTITKVNAASLQPGDRVRFNGGETFAGRIIPNSWVGTDATPILIDSYGLPAPAVINGSASSALYINDATSHHLWFENLDFAGATGANVQTVRCYTHDVRFKDCIMRDSADWIGFSAYSATGAGIYNITLDGCTFTNNYKSGIFVGSDTGALGPHDVLITGCTSHHNGHGAAGDHGYYIKHGVTVDGCTAYNNADAGIKVNCETVTDSPYAPIVRNSVSYANLTGIYVGAIRAKIYNNLVYSNTTYNLLFDADGDDCEIYGNTFVNSTHATERAIGLNGTTSTGNIIKNNLFIQDTAVVTRGILASVSSSFADVATNNTWDYNTYYVNGSATSTVFGYSATGAAAKSWNDWVAAGAEAHGTFLTAVPDFRARYTDLQPMLTGNLLGLGVAIEGYGTDKNGVTRTSPPTPGCFDDPQPELVTFASAEVGSAGATLVRVTFSTKILASNYATGVTIKVAGATATISTAEREAGDKIVRYTLSAAVVEGQAVTWEYNSTTGNYSNTSSTYNLPTYTAQTVTNAVVNTLVDIDLETGDLTQFSSMVSDDCTVTAGAALNGTTRGLLVTIDDTTSTYGVKTFTASATGVWRAGFYADPNTLTMGANNTFTMLGLFNGANQVAGVELNYNGGYAIRGMIISDAASLTETTRHYITDGPHVIELKLTRASSNVASDGRVDLYVDGSLRQSTTGIDNYDHAAQLTEIRFGATEGVDAGTSGTIYLDEMVVNNNGNQIF